MPTLPSALRVAATPVAADGMQPHPGVPLHTRSTRLVVASSSSSPSCVVAGPVCSTPTHVTQSRDGQGARSRHDASHVAVRGSAAHVPASMPRTTCVLLSSPPPPSLLLLLLLGFGKNPIPSLLPVAPTPRTSPSQAFGAGRCPLWLRLCGARRHAYIINAAAATGITSRATTTAAATCRVIPPVPAIDALRRTPLSRPASLLVPLRGSPCMALPGRCRPYSTAAEPPPPSKPAAAVSPQAVLDLSDADASAYSSVSAVTAGAPGFPKRRAYTSQQGGWTTGAPQHQGRRSTPKSRSPSSPHAGSRQQCTSSTSKHNASHLDARASSSQQPASPSSAPFRSSANPGHNHGGFNSGPAEAGRRKRTGRSRSQRHCSAAARAARDDVQTTWLSGAAQIRGAAHMPPHEHKKPDADEQRQLREEHAGTAASSATAATSADGAPSASDQDNGSGAAVAEMHATAGPLSIPPPPAVLDVPNKDGVQSDAALRRLLAMHPTFLSNYVTMQKDEKVALSLERLCAEALADSGVLEDLAKAMNSDTPDTTHSAAASSAAGPQTVFLSLTSSPPSSAPHATLAVLEVSPTVVQWLDQVIALPPLSIHHIAGCLEVLQQRAVAVAAGAGADNDDLTTGATASRRAAAAAAAAGTPSGTSCGVEGLSNPVLDLWYEAWGRQHCAGVRTPRGTAKDDEAQSSTMERWQHTQSHVTNALLAHFTGHDGDWHESGDSSNGHGQASASSFSRFRRSAKAPGAPRCTNEKSATRLGQPMNGAIRGLLPYLASLLSSLCSIKRGRLECQLRADAARVSTADKSRSTASEAPAGSYAHLCYVAQRTYARVDTETEMSAAAAAELLTATQEYRRSIAAVDAVYTTITTTTAHNEAGEATVARHHIAVLDACIGMLLRVLVLYFPILSPKVRDDLLITLMKPWLRQQQEAAGEGEYEGEDELSGGDAGHCPCPPAGWHALLSVDRTMRGVRAGVSSSDGLMTSSMERGGLKEVIQLVEFLRALWQPTVLDVEARVVQRVLALPASGQSLGSADADATAPAAPPAVQRHAAQLPRWIDVVNVVCATRARQRFVYRLLTLAFATLAAATVPLTGAPGASLSLRHPRCPNSPRPIDVSPVVLCTLALDSVVLTRLSRGYAAGAATALFTDDMLPAGTLRTLVRRNGTCPYPVSRLFLWLLTPLLESTRAWMDQGSPGQRRLFAVLVERAVIIPVASVLREVPPLPVQREKRAGAHSNDSSSIINPDGVDAGAVLGGVVEGVPLPAAQTWCAVAPIMSMLHDCALPSVWAAVWETISAWLRKAPADTAASAEALCPPGTTDPLKVETHVKQVTELGVACAWLQMMAPEAERQAQQRMRASTDAAAEQALRVLHAARVAESFAQCVKDFLTALSQVGARSEAGELLLAHCSLAVTSTAAAALAAYNVPAKLQGGAAGGVSKSRPEPRDGDGCGAAASLNAAESAMLVELATVAQTRIWVPALRDEVAEWIRKTALMECVQAPALSPAVPLPAAAAAAAAASVADTAPVAPSLQAAGITTPESLDSAAAAGAAPASPSPSPLPSMDATLMHWWRGLRGADLGLAAAPVLLPEVWATLSRIVLARANTTRAASGEAIFTAEEVLVIVRQLSRIASRNMVSILLEERVHSPRLHSAATRHTASPSGGSLILVALRRVVLHVEPGTAAAVSAQDAASSAATTSTRTGGSSSSDDAPTGCCEEKQTTAELVDRVEAALLDSLAVHLPTLPAMTVVEAAWLRLCSLSTVSNLLLRYTEDYTGKGSTSAAAFNAEQLQSADDTLVGPAMTHSRTTSTASGTAPLLQLGGTLRAASHAWLRALHEAVASSPHACHIAGAFVHTFYRLLSDACTRRSRGGWSGTTTLTQSTAVLQEFAMQLNASCAEAAVAQYTESATSGTASAAVASADADGELAALTHARGPGHRATHARGAPVSTVPASAHAPGSGGGSASSSLPSPSPAAAGEDARDAEALPSSTTPREAHGLHYLHVCVLASQLHMRLLPASSGAAHDTLLDDVWVLYAALLKAAEALLAHADLGNMVEALRLVAVVSERLPWPLVSTDGNYKGTTVQDVGAQESSDAVAGRAAESASAPTTRIVEPCNGEEQGSPAAIAAGWPPPPAPHAEDVEAVSLRLHDRFRRLVQRAMPHVDSLVVEQAKRETPRLLTVMMLAITKGSLDRLLRQGGGGADAVKCRGAGAAVQETAAAAATAQRTSLAAPTLSSGTERRAVMQHAMWQRVPLTTLLQHAAPERSLSWHEAPLLCALFATTPEVSAALPSMLSQLRDLRTRLPWRGVDAVFQAIAVAAADSQNRGEANVLRRDGDGAGFWSYASSPPSSASGAGRAARWQGTERTRRTVSSSSSSSSSSPAPLQAVPGSMVAGAAAVRVGELHPPPGDADHSRTVPVFRSAAAMHASRAPPFSLRQAWGAFAKRLLEDETNPALSDASLWVAALYSGALTGCAGTQLFASLLASLMFGVDADAGAPRVHGLDMAGWTLLLQACAAPSGQQRQRQTHQALLEAPLLEFVDRATAGALDAAKASEEAGELAVHGPERCAFIESIPPLFIADAAVWRRVRRCVEAWVAALDVHPPVPASASSSSSSSSSTDAHRREWAVQWQQSFNWAVRSGGHGSLAFAETWCDTAAAAESAAVVEWMQAQLSPLVECGDGSHKASR